MTIATMKRGELAAVPTSPTLPAYRATSSANASADGQSGGAAYAMSGNRNEARAAAGHPATVSVTVNSPKKYRCPIATRAAGSLMGDMDF